ncbi:ferritin-like superfamily [Tribonema minus]|uniref:Ferritin-like superfamily n=1 Tax=Tribonema minus TaxID=303371 RepID=A0A835ZGW8_9STRA|nr:ferritin-like superfamily [Tribonema minus]
MSRLGFEGAWPRSSGGRSPPSLLIPNPSRFVVFPIQHDDVWDMYKRAQASLWTAEEMDLAHDPKDFDGRLNDDERHFLLWVLAFFAASDGIVTENLAMNFCSEVQIPEARCFYAFQIAIEALHGEVYSLMIDALVRDPAEKADLFDAVRTVPCVARKAGWALRWFDADRASFAERLVAFAAVEGIFFSASFCAIFWVKKRGLMPGLCFSNELISRDEGLHTDFACLLYGKLLTPLPSSRVAEIISSAVEVEEEFVRDALRVEVIGMNGDLMMQYVRCVADRLALALGANKGDANPFDWMDMISLQGKTSFFERRVGEYAKSGVGQDAGERAFATDADF